MEFQTTGPWYTIDLYIIVLVLGIWKLAAFIVACEWILQFKE